MARGRLILRTLGSSRKFAEARAVGGKLGEFAQTLYMLLVTTTDDYGRQAGDAFTVKHAVFPTSPRREEEFDEALNAMHTAGLIVRYVADGRQIIQIVEFGKGQPNLHKRTASTFPEFPGISGKVPENPGRREEKRREENLTEEKGTALRAGAPISAEFIEAWNAETQPPIPKCRDVTPSRQQKIGARLKDRSMEDWREVFRRIQRSAFCRGQNDRGWTASFDWVIANQDNALKVLEGKYDDRARGPTLTKRSEQAVTALQQFAKPHDDQRQAEIRPMLQPARGSVA